LGLTANVSFPSQSESIDCGSSHVFGYNPGRFKQNYYKFMGSENYLNHPTFGLLFRLCSTEANQELFSTLYAQRLFFLVEMSPTGLKVEAIGRMDAKLLVETQIRILRRNGNQLEFDALMKTYKQLF
jgi:PII interaction protein X